MAAVLFAAKCKQKAAGGKPNTLCIDLFSYRAKLRDQRKRGLPQHQKHTGPGAEVWCSGGDDGHGSNRSAAKQVKTLWLAEIALDAAAQ
jgi:hypothetical protein